MNTETENSSTGVAEHETASPSEGAALEVLGKVIEELHDLAQRSMRTSLDYARLAGVKLIEAKAMVKFGQWQSWIATRCGFSQATANLYMKIAREWNQYGESQRVGSFTLRDAAQLLYMDNDEEHANAVGDLVNLDILRWPDLDGLDPIERRVFVDEVRSFYEDHCFDDDTHKVSDDVKAKRVALGDGWREPFWDYNHGAIKTMVHDVIRRLKAGELMRQNIRADLRAMEIRAQKTDDQQKEGERLIALNEPRPSKRAVQKKLKVKVYSVGALDWFGQLSQRFVWGTRDLLTSGALVQLNSFEVMPIVREVRRVLDEIEKHTGNGSLPEQGVPQTTSAAA